MTQETSTEAMIRIFEEMGVTFIDCETTKPVNPRLIPKIVQQNKNKEKTKNR